MPMYKVKLNMSDEYMVEAENLIKAELLARDKFGCDYLIDSIDIKEEKREMRMVSASEFFEEWKEMCRRFNETFFDEEKENIHNQIMNQPINIELPLLGIKTDVGFCPPVLEAMNKMYNLMLDDEYVELLVQEESCCHTGGGILLSEIPFEYHGLSLVMVVDSENTEEWTIYHNVLKDNGKYDSVEYDELVFKYGNSFDEESVFQKYYIRALQLLANR